MKHNYYNLNIAQYAVFSFPEYNLNNFLVIQSEPKYQLAIYEILLFNIKAYSSANLLKLYLKFYQLHLILLSLISSLNLRQLSVIHQKLFNLKKIYIKHFHMKTLNQHCPNLHIFVLSFRSCSSPDRKNLIDWFPFVSLLTTTHKQRGEHDLILYFHFLLS